MKASGWARVLASAVLALLPLGACGGVSGRSGSSGGAGGSIDGAAGGAALGRCEYRGQMFDVEEVFPADDGCNSCRCGEDLQVSCGHVPCHVCRDLEAEHAALLEQAKSCDPSQPNACDERIQIDLECLCKTFGTEPQPSQAQGFFPYTDLGCGGREPCSCPIPVSGACSPEGRCVDTFEPAPGPACRLGSGDTYPSGSVDVPDLFACNRCNCDAGTLSCTELPCSSSCPEGWAVGNRCAECGPSGECLIVETDCYQKCTEPCDGRPCVDGLCVNTCP